MGEHREKTGKTRVGKFLQGLKSVAPSVLNLAGNITGIEGLNKLADAIHGGSNLSEEDYDTALALIELDKIEMAEVTKRHMADMTSDSWLSKNVRPITLIGLSVAFIGLVVIDSTGLNFTVDEQWIILFKSLLIPVYLFYFGGREVQKAIINHNKYKR